MKTILVLVAAAAVLFVAGCGGNGGTFNVSEQFSAEVGQEANCKEAGLKEVAGEREMTYSCGLKKDYGYTRVCVFIVDSELYVARQGEC